jgi:hypothetical protein
LQQIQLPGSALGAYSVHKKHELEKELGNALTALKTSVSSHLPGLAERRDTTFQVLFYTNERMNATDKEWNDAKGVKSVHAAPENTVCRHLYEISSQSKTFLSLSVLLEVPERK